MRGIRTSYLVTVAMVWCLNGWALLQHLSIVPGFKALIAATLLTNMLAAPLVIWIAYVYGELTEEEILRRKHATAATERRAR